MYKKSVYKKKFLFFLFLIVLTGSVKAATIFSDGFESGSLGGWSLSHAAGANDWTASTTNPFQGSYHAQSQPSSTTEPASIMERTISTSGYQNIIINYSRKLIELDGVDEFQVEWYDGSTWAILEQTGTDSANDAVYISKQYSLPSGANDKPAFAIKFECTAGAVSEFCRLDNVLIMGDVMDNTPPIITLNSPKSNQFINVNSVIFNITLNEDGSSAIYSLNNGVANVTMSSLDNRNYNSTNTSIANGQYTARFYANDTNGNINNTLSVIFTIDTIKPLLSIKTPQNTSYNLLQNQLNYSVSDLNLQSCWYNLNNGQTNISVTCGQNITGLTNNEGINSWRIYANDSAGNTNFSLVSFFLDSIKPNVNIIFPANNQWFNYKNIEINTSVSDTNLQSCWWTNNSGITNNSIACNINLTNQQWKEGQNTISIYANDSLNNLNSSTIIFYIDTIAPSLVINNPGNQSYNNASLLINITSNGNYVWFFNGTANETYSSPVIKTFLQGNNIIYAYSNDSLNNINFSSITFFVDSIAPSLNIEEPQSKTYGKNASLSLNFSASDTNLQSCWYNLNNNQNISLPNCQNTTFNVTIDGNYNLSLFANDSLGNIAKQNTSFSVITTAPAINLIYPKNSIFLNYAQNIQFNYSVISGIGVSECELWGDFNGLWQLNQTNNTISLENNFFILNLQEGNFNWGIICNDTQNRASSVNSTFSIDITLPQISLTEPSGTKTSRSNIPLTFSASDTNLQICWYNVFEGILPVWPNTTVSCSLGTGTFNLSSDASLVLNLYANDSAGNTNFSSIVFTIDTSTPSTSSPPSSGGGGGGGGGGFPAKRNLTAPPKIVFNQPANLIFKRGTSTTTEIEITNEEKIFLNGCKLIITGLQSPWFSNSQSKGLSPGEKFKFILNIKIPEEAEPGDYAPAVTVKCDEGQQSTSLSLTVFRNNFETKITNYQRTVDTLQVFYSIKEFSQKDHNIALEYELFNIDKISVVKGKELISIKANEEKTSLLEFKIPKDITGEFTLKMLLDDSETSNAIAQQIFLQSQSILGLAISDSNKKTLSIFGIILLSTIALFFISRFIYQRYRRHKINTLLENIEEKHGKRLIKLDVRHKHN